MAQFTEIGVIATVKNLTTFTGGMSQMREQMGLTGRSAINLSRSVSTAGQGILNAGRTIRALGNEITFLGFQLTFLATGAFAAVTAKGIEFEETVVRMSTLASATTSELGELAAAAQRLGPQLGIGPTELADAMFDIVSSGFSAAEALDIIESTGKGAAIGLGDVRTVTDAVTSAMRAFADEGLTASRATDILVSAVREGKGEVDALSGTIGRVLGIAGELGLTFEETAAFIATFTRVGVPAEVAVTSLRSALTNILKPTQGARDALAEYKLSMDDIRAIISEKGLASGLLTLASVLGDDDEAMAKVIGSARGLAGVLINTGPLAADYVQVLSSIENQLGITEDAFDLFEQTTRFKLNAAKAAFESLFITVSNALRPLVNLILDQIPKITAAIDEFVKLNPKMALVVGGFIAIAAAMGPILIVGGLLITSVGTLISIFGALAVAIGSLVSPLGLVLAILSPFAITFVGVFATMLKNTKDELDRQGRSLSSAALQWGRNIIIQLSNGMAQAAVYIIRVLTDIANIIAGLLRPGSPPKLLPDLDKWGAGAMNAYLEGWKDADFNVFNDIARTMESFFRSFITPEVDIVPTIISMRTEIAKLVDTFRETGAVSMEAISAIAANFGQASAAVTNYIQALLGLEAANHAVEAAQQRLNEAQEKYKRLLEPINKELDSIAARRQEVVDNMRIAELQSIIADSSAPALAKELAAMELREIELRNQRDAIEDARDAEVDRAQEALDAANREQELARSRVEAMRQFIEIQQQNNELIKEQISLLEKLNETIGGGGGVDPIGVGDIDTGDITGGTDDPVTNLKDEVDKYIRKLGAEELGLTSGDLGGLGIFGTIEEAASNLVTNLETTFSGIGDEIAEQWKPALQAFEELKSAWQDILDLTPIDEDSPIGKLIAYIKDLSSDEIQNFSDLVSELKRFNDESLNLQPETISDLAKSLEKLGQAISNLTGGDDGPLAKLTEFLGPDGPFGDLVVFEETPSLGEFILEFLIPIKKITKAIELFNDALEAANIITLDELLSRVSGDITALSTLISEELQPIVDSITGWFGEDGDIANAFAHFVSWLQSYIPTHLATADAKTKTHMSSMRKSSLFNINEMVKNGLIRFGEFVDGIVGGDGHITQLVTDLVNGDTALIPFIQSEAEKIFGNMKDAIVGEDGIIAQLKQGILDKIQEVLDNLGLPTTIEAWKDVGRNLAQGLINGIIEKIQDAIASVRGAVEDLLQRGFREPTQEQSPSRVTMKIGEYLIDGLRLGMESRYGTVISSLSNFTNGLMGDFESSGTNIGISMGSKPGYMTRANSVSQPVSAPSVMNNSTSRNSSFGPIYINDSLDVAALRIMIRQEINGAL